MQTLKETQPIARKQHRCDFCYGTITVGQRYRRQTNIVDGEIGDFICHIECMEVARMLDMFDDCDPDYGLTDEMFREKVMFAAFMKRWTLVIAIICAVCAIKI